MSGAKVQIQFVAAAVGGRDSAPLCSPYRPHFRVGQGEYLGVEFVGEADARASSGELLHAQVRFMYPGVSYEALKPGVQFVVLEGPHIVGVGVVRELLS